MTPAWSMYVQVPKLWLRLDMTPTHYLRFPSPWGTAISFFPFYRPMASCRCSKQYIHVDPSRRTVSIRAINYFKHKRFTCKGYETPIAPQSRLSSFIGLNG
jgi:hypothetical protein